MSKWCKKGALHHVCSIFQGFGFENGRRVINCSPWVGKGSCFFFNAHGYKYISLNADLSEYIIIFTSHLFICVRMCVVFRHTDEASLLVVSAKGFIGPLRS